MLRTAVLCNDAVLQKDGEPEQGAVGSPTENALLEAAVKDITDEAADEDSLHTTSEHGPGWAGEAEPRPRNWPLIIAVLVAGAICLSLVLMYLDIL